MAGPLARVRVLDFTIFQQGPQATLVMADMGADVIKAEPPGFGDLGRVLQMHGEHRVSAYHLAHSRGKRSITINLKSAEGVEVARRLCAWADVFVHNFRPGVMERLGLGYDEVRAINPRIIYAHASGWGARGPKATHPAFDIAAQARSGLMSMTGEADGGPLPVGVAIADYVGAMNFALSIIAALYARDRTGAAEHIEGDAVNHEGARKDEESGRPLSADGRRGDGASAPASSPTASVPSVDHPARNGQKVETSLFGAAIAAQAWELQTYALGRQRRRSGRGHAYLPTIWRTFQTADGWAVIGGVGDNRWPAFCRAISMPDLEQDERFATGLSRIANIDALYAVLDGHFVSKTTAAWMELLEACDMICAPVADHEAVLQDEQAIANEYIVEVDHPTLGRTQVVGHPWTFSETPPTVAAAAPELGEHTEEILLDLGYSWDEIGALREAKAV